MAYYNEFHQQSVCLLPQSILSSLDSSSKLSSPLELSTNPQPSVNTWKAIHLGFNMNLCLIMQGFLSLPEVKG